MPSKKVIEPRSLKQREIGKAAQAGPKHVLNKQGTQQPKACTVCEPGTIHYAAE